MDAAASAPPTIANDVSARHCRLMIQIDHEKRRKHLERGRQRQRGAREPVRFVVHPLDRQNQQKADQYLGLFSCRAKRPGAVSDRAGREMAK